MLYKSSKKFNQTARFDEKVKSKYQVTSKSSLNPDGCPVLWANVHRY
jgi:hypothetical protein